MRRDTPPCSVPNRRKRWGDLIDDIRTKIRTRPGIEGQSWHAMSTKLDSPSYHFRYCSTLYRRGSRPQAHSESCVEITNMTFQLIHLPLPPPELYSRGVHAGPAWHWRCGRRRGCVVGRPPRIFHNSIVVIRAQLVAACMRPRSRSIEEPRKRMPKTSNVDNYCQTFSSKYLGFHLAINVLSTHFSVLPDVGESWRLYKILERRSCTEQF